MAVQIHSVPAVLSDEPCEVALRAVCPALRPYVLGLSGFRSGHGRPIAHLLLPLAHPTVIVDFGARSGLVLGARAAATARGETTWGHGISIGLTPLGAAALLGVPMSELGGPAVRLDELLGPGVTELPGRLAAAPSWAERFDLIERVLLHLRTARTASPDRVACSPDPAAWFPDRAVPAACSPDRVACFPDRAVLAAWQRLQRPGPPKVDVLAAELNVTRRRLERGFRQHVGLTPATVARIARFQRVVGRLVSGAGPSEAAADSGYADHPHLARETRAMAGLTPTRLAAYLSTPPVVVANVQDARRR
ncbi:AraC family transcriptional regulator [Paractinoplanes brasiliensis]|uniref:Helix-turn-helix protein n=1 Tax=Paractinoplanes brasiliensis TaxID=52695 RepID=A0A4V3C5U9_9ACTN|nr:helix-turn-helix domain-containing protein [Actinoplanes brasiliensis]TDO31258.1 helix-turn-helix protein [Actinoplanes brasiliensis]